MLKNNKFENLLIFGLSYSNLKKKSLGGYNLDEKNTLNEMIIKYENKGNKDDKISLFGEKFVRNNKNKYFITIQGKNY